MSNQDYIFGLAAFDINGNEFDSMNGIKISWFLGANTEIAKFQVSNEISVQIIPSSIDRKSAACLGWVKSRVVKSGRRFWATLYRTYWAVTGKKIPKIRNDANEYKIYANSDLNFHVFFKDATYKNSY